MQKHSLLPKPSFPFFGPLGKQLGPSSPTPLGEQTDGPRAGLTVAGHAQRQAFLQAAVLAAVAVGAVDQAVPLPGAGVAGVVLLAPPEESLHGTGRLGDALPAPPHPAPRGPGLTLQPSQVMTP